MKKCQLKTVCVVLPLFLTLNTGVSQENDADASYSDGWNIATNIYLEIESFKGNHVNRQKVYDKISPTFQLSARHPDSKWQYALEMQRSMRNYTTGFHSRQTSYNRNRILIKAEREMYQDEIASFKLAGVYRYENNDVRSGMPAKNSSDSFWLVPSGSYQFSEQWGVSFWDAFYFYKNKIGKNSLEWESEHGFEYKASDQFTAKLMLYTDWTWDSSGNKTWEQNQIRGYFPTQINEQWKLEPYFRYFLNDKTYNAAGNTVQSADHGGLRLGLVTTYNATDKTAIWSNMAWERTSWRCPKADNLTHGASNKQSLRLFSLGVQHTF